MGNLGGFTRKATRKLLRQNGGKFGKKFCNTFCRRTYFKQIPVSVKRTEKKEECPSGLILVNSNCEFKRAEGSCESSRGEEDEVGEGENNSDQDQTSSSCSESGEISKSGEVR